MSNQFPSKVPVEYVKGVETQPMPSYISYGFAIDHSTGAKAAPVDIVEMDLGYRYFSTHSTLGKQDHVERENACGLSGSDVLEANPRDLRTPRKEEA